MLKTGECKYVYRKVLEYFHKPKNLGKIKNADGVGKVGNLAWRYDVLILKLKKKEKKKSSPILSFRHSGA